MCDNILNFLFDSTVENAFVYIGGNNAGTSIPMSERQLYFWIAVIPSMIFSPIGEELLYRGVVHGSFVSKFGENRASIFDSLAFALTHSSFWYYICLWNMALFTDSSNVMGCSNVRSKSTIFPL